MQIERYARGWAELNGIECHPGLEIRAGDNVEELVRFVQYTAQRALSLGKSHSEIAVLVKEHFAHRYADRAWFVETEEDGRGVQVVNYGAFGRGNATGER